MSDDPDLKKLGADLQKATDEVKTFAEKANTEMKNLGKITEDTKASADKALTEMNALAKKLDEAEKKTESRIADIEQKMARRGGTQVEEVKSIGQHVIEDEGVKAFLSGSRRGQVHVKIEGKTIANLTSGTGTVGSTASVTTSLVTPDRQGLVMLPERRFTVRDLITPGQTSSGNIEYPVEVSYQNEAATVAEAGAKPQSDTNFDLRSSPVRTIATYMKASRQILDDAPQLQSYIDGRLRYFLMLVEEAQLLLGDGTGQNLLGIQSQASAYSAAFTVTGETAIDRLRLASLQATLALYPSTGYVLHPTDWAKIEMTKDGMGRYLVGNPTGGVFTGSLSYMPTLWGLPVVATPAQTVNNFLVGAFKLGAQIFDRLGMEVLLSTEDQDNFVKNMITIRGEERLALAVYRPGAFITGTLP